MTAPVRPLPPDLERDLTQATAAIQMGARQHPQQHDQYDAEIAAALGGGASASPAHAGDPYDAEIAAALGGNGGQVGHAGKLLNAAAQGLTFGFADEALGAVNGLDAKLHGRTFGEGYDEGVNKVRGVSREFAQEHPVESLAAGLVGGAVPAILTGGASAAASAGEGLPLLARATQQAVAGAKIGAGYGALSGVGNAEGGLAERAAGGAIGGALGAATGGALGGAAPFVGRGVSAATSRFRPVPAEVSAIAGRDLATGVPSRDSKWAAETVRGALERDKKSPAQLADEILALRQQGIEPGTLMDLGGENTIDLGRTAQSVPGRAKDAMRDALKDRQAGDFGRVRGQLETGTGAQHGDIFQTLDDLVAEREAKGSPLYRAAFEHAPVADDEIQSLLQRPSTQRALRYAQEVASEEGKPLPALDAPATESEAIQQAGQAPRAPVPPRSPAEMQAQVAGDRATLAARKAAEQRAFLKGEDLYAGPGHGAVEPIADLKAALGTASRGPSAPPPQGPSPIPVETLHRVKLALDDMLHLAERAAQTGAAAADEGGKGPSGLRAIAGTRAALLKRMDELVPEYAKAREVWAGESAVKSALEKGRDAFAKRIDERLVARQVKDLEPAEREMYRKGAVDALVAEMRKAKDGRDFVRQIFGSPDERDRVRALFDSDADFARFKAAMEHFQQRHHVESTVLGGPATARIQAGQAVLDDGAADVVQTAAGGPRALVRRLADEALSARRGARADALAPYLLAGSKGQPSLELALAALNHVRAQSGLAPLSALPRVASGAVGNQTGRLLSPGKP